MDTLKTSLSLVCLSGLWRQIDIIFATFGIVTTLIDWKLFEYYEPAISLVRAITTTTTADYYYYYYCYYYYYSYYYLFNLLSPILKPLRH